MKSKKRLVIAIIIILILVLAIAGAGFAYLYIKTDTFRTDQELFAKYISQNAETLQKFSDSQTIKQYDRLQFILRQSRRHKAKRREPLNKRGYANAPERMKKAKPKRLQQLKNTKGGRIWHL